MGRLVRVRCGQWARTEGGIWVFNGDPGESENYVLTRTNEEFPALLTLLRKELNISLQTPVVLTYRLPGNMIHPADAEVTPINIASTEDLEAMMSVHEWTNEVYICVTCGAMNVAKYQFLCRTPFEIGDKKFLFDGVTEEEHMAAVIEMIDEDEFNCSARVLRESKRTYDLNVKPPSERGTANVSESHGGSHILGVVGDPDTSKFSAEWDGIDMGPGYWEAMIEHGYANHEEGEPGVEDYVDVINLANDLSMEEDAPVVGQRSIVDVDESSTGSTEVPSVGDMNVDRNDVGVAIDGNGDSARASPEDKDNIPYGSTVFIYTNVDVTENNPDAVYVGMVFRTREDFKRHLAMTVDLEHTCSVDDRSGYQSQATHSIIGEIMKARFTGRGGGPRPNDIMQAMQGDHGVHISYWKAWRSREIALANAKGSCGASYNLLPAYLEKLVHANPGTVTDVHTEYTEGVGHRFKYMFMALAASIEGFKFMRKVVIVDGTHLRGKYADCLLTASAQDGNYQVFPLAIAVVDGENDKSWEWFLQKLTQFIPNTNDVVFVSDRHPSIYYGLAKVYPYGRHCACILHLKRNIRTYYKDKHLGYLVGKAARAYRLSDFNTAFNEIKKVNASCAEYLDGVGFEHWARSHFQGDRFNIMTSNIAETWNSVLREATEYPILSLVEYIRAKLMNWFSGRREIVSRGASSLTPRVEEIITSNFENSGAFLVSSISIGEYEVRDKDGASFHVNLKEKTCSCYEFQALKIPCTHAIAAATRNRIPVEPLVAEFYSLSIYKEAYGRTILPVVEQDTVEVLTGNSTDTQPNVNPPVSRRPPGRPRKNRFLSRGEFQMRVQKKRTICSRCKCTGS
ncbi:hypothetical protein Bca4012_066230 [Brassica carinata]